MTTVKHAETAAQRGAATAAREAATRAAVASSASSDSTDQPGRVGHQPVAVADRTDPHGATGVRRLHHPPVADVEGHVVDVAAVRPEQHVAGPDLRDRHLLAGVVLVAAV